VHVVLDGEVLMPPNSRRILPGTTRGVVEELAARAGIPHRIAPISEAQLRAAAEVWISAATRELQAVTSLDGHPVGSGRPGALWRRLYDELQAYKQELAGTPW
jgi:D-alanine transaminase